MRYGVIDIGSNSVKFLVAEKIAQEVKVLQEQSYSTRLAEDLIATAELTDLGWRIAASQANT